MVDGKNQSTKKIKQHTEKKRYRKNKELTLNALISGSVKMVLFPVVASFAIVFYILTKWASFQISHVFTLFW